MALVADIVIPLPANLQSRDGGLTKDALMTNCFAEPRGEALYVSPRPGSALLSSTVTGADAQGAFNVNGGLFVIQNNIIYQINSASTWALVGDAPVAYSTTPLSLAYPMLIQGNFLWTFDGTTLIKVTAPAYPSATVPGLVVLDSTVYVMTVDGQIRGSAVNNPTSWSALNSIVVDKGLGNPTWLIRHLSYIVAMGDAGIQSFYDAANPAPGSPLSPVSNDVSPFGNIYAIAPAVYRDTVAWVTVGNRSSYSIMMMEQGKVSTISTVDIEKVLAVQGGCVQYTFAFHLEGATFYGFTSTACKTTFIYHKETGLWGLWTSPSVLSGETCYPFLYMRSNSQGGITAVSVLTGAVVTLSMELMGDALLPQFSSYARTARLDGGTAKRKFNHRLALAADTSPSSIVSLRYTDDDYQTWSAWRDIDLSYAWKQLNRLGSFRSRAFELRYRGVSASVGFQSLELDVEKGSR